MSQYSVAIIGHTGRGDYGHGLDTCWQQLPNFQVVAVADPVPEGLGKAVQRTGARRGYDDYRQMLERERPRIVAVAPRWADQHHAIALACAEHGCHMYMEKPFCQNLNQADEIIQACEMRHVKLAVAHISRYSPQLAVVKKLIAEGAIGDVLELHGRGKEDARGGGEDFWVLGSHVLDSMHAIAGAPIRCHATLWDDDQLVTARSVHEGNEGLGPLAGTQLVAMYEFAGTVLGFWSSRKNAGGSPSRFGLRIVGTKGVIQIASGYGVPAYLLEDPTWSTANSQAHWRTISSSGLDQPETLTSTGYDGAHPVVIEDLVQAIQEDRQPKCSMYEARNTIQMIMAAFESHRQGGAVDLPLQVAGNPLLDW
ncbi:MAG: Gfo/Idh/MocA family oxidoreductase [Pirellulaceae bacterium]|nr:Gfo/Idh/MocA family oxidoreductase [Pirellulaceae bacterium]